MNKFELNGKFLIKFRMNNSNEELFLFQIKHSENESVVFSIENCYAKIISIKDEVKKEIILGCYITSCENHTMILDVNNNIDIDIDNKFIYSIGSLSSNIKFGTLYEPLKESQKALKILKFEKT